MKRLLKVFTVLFIILALAIVAVSLWQRDNIKSILIGVYEDSSEIERQRTDNQTNLVEELNSYMDVPVREITEEEKQKVESGETTATDIYQYIFEENSEGKVNGTTGSLSDKDSIISKYMAKLYGLQNSYMAKAESLISQGASYYESIKKGNGDPAARATTISHFTPLVRGLESECDGKVEAVIADLSAELKAIGADTSIIKTIRTTYANEKQLKLSYYANKYLR